MAGTKFKIIISVISAIIAVSCSQKYDNSGIFDPLSPDFSAVSVSFISGQDTLVLAKDRVRDGYIYLGKDSGAWAEPLFRCTLPDLYGLDSAFVTYKLYEYHDSLDISQYFNGKLIEVLKTVGPWTPDGITYPVTGSVPVDTLTLVPDSAGAKFFFRFELKRSMIEQWVQTDSTNSAGFYVRPIDDIPRIIKFYSAGFGFDSQKPLVTSHYTFTDSLTAADGSDSTLFETKSVYVTEDVTLAQKMSSCIDPAENRFKIGGVSGESYICRIPLDTIPTQAVLLTGRILLTAAAEKDPVYGGIENSVTTNRELCVYILTDSLWQDGGPVSYDSVNVWIYKINLGAPENYLLMETPIQNWISDPASNYGFLITSKNWGSPFGFSTFEKPLLNISYIKNEE